MIVHRVDLDHYPYIVRVKVLHVLRKNGVRFLAESVADDSVRDMFQEGWIAYLLAQTTYDPSQGASFDTYAAIRIEGAVRDYVRRLRYLPRKVSKRKKPDFHSLDAIENVPDEQMHPGEQVEVEHDDAVIKTALEDHLGSLSRLQSLVIRWCYYQDPPLTLQEIGALVGRTESRICQIRKEALRRLRTMIERDPRFH